MIRSLLIVFTVFFTACVSIPTTTLLYEHCVKTCIEKEEKSDNLEVERDLKEQLDVCLDDCEDNDSICETLCYVDFGPYTVESLQTEMKDVRRDNCEEECTKGK
jgi:hypothetical protein